MGILIQNEALPIAIMGHCHCLRRWHERELSIPFLKLHRKEESSVHAPNVLIQNAQEKHALPTAYRHARTAIKQVAKEGTARNLL
jgi:hypothetical protein